MAESDKAAPKGMFQKIAEFAAVAASFAGIGSFFGFDFGKSQTVNNINSYITTIEANAPAQISEFGSVLEFTRKVVSNGASGDVTPQNAAADASALARTVAGFPARAGVITLMRNRTERLCEGRDHISYLGPNQRAAGRHEFLVDGQLWIALPGSKKQFLRRVVITALTIAPDSAVIDSECL